MTFSADVFWPAFKQAGMLEPAVYQPDAGGQPVLFDVSFSRPDVAVLDGMVHSTDYTIEYQRADVELKRGLVISIEGVSYKVRQTPNAKGEGTFAVAILEKVIA